MNALSKEEEEPQAIHTDVSNINRRKKDANKSQPCLQHHKHNKTRIFHTSIQITSTEEDMYTIHKHVNNVKRIIRNANKTQKHVSKLKRRKGNAINPHTFGQHQKKKKRRRYIQI